MTECTTRIIINGMDRTEDVFSCEYSNGKYDVIFRGSGSIYSYSASKVKFVKPLAVIDPRSVIFSYKGKEITELVQIIDYGDFYRISRENGTSLTCSARDVKITKDCLRSPGCKELFSYFKELAALIGITTPEGLNILQMQYDRVKSVSEHTVLANYLNPKLPIRLMKDRKPLIFPFGLNQSQKTAVENAFTSQISLIQGPPGTGKTQTILNIISNAVLQNKTVAVVSNNNDATQNVVDKLEKQGFGFLTAYLGSLENKQNFLKQQTGTYPDMRHWELSQADHETLAKQISALTEELGQMLSAKNRIAQINQEILTIQAEYQHFKLYYPKKFHIIPKNVTLLSSGKLLELLQEYEAHIQKQISLIRKLIVIFRFGWDAKKVFDFVPEKAIPFLQDTFYTNRMKELQAEKERLEALLKGYQFAGKMEDLRQKSLRMFRHTLSQRYLWQAPRRKFDDMSQFRRNSPEVAAEYPVILSTTHSIKGTLTSDFIYDYLIVDEASQVDLATGVLALASAKNVVIVGDHKQLPNVVTPANQKITDAVWLNYRLEEHYRYSTHSLLTSAAEIWPEAPTVLLREHYRCHPKIAEFCNRKFYGGELIIMTEDRCEEDVLLLYRTAAGNHARGHINQRQIDVIHQEILPRLHQQHFEDIGIIAPYRDQVDALRSQVSCRCDIDTVHKFQGREKEAIVLSTVDNVIGSFVDDPNMLNVAVSRAIRSLSVVISNDPQNDATNYGDLARYIAYQNCQIIDSKVFSVFDLLYKANAAARKQYLLKQKRISEYDSENLAYTLISQILKEPDFTPIDCVPHFSLATLVKDHTLLTSEESRYALNPLTHLDFLLFRKMDKSPVMAIEVDGIAFHKAESRQGERDRMKNSILGKCGIPLLRLRTNGSGEDLQIRAMLQTAIQGTALQQQQTAVSIGTTVS